MKLPYTVAPEVSTLGVCWFRFNDTTKRTCLSLARTLFLCFIKCSFVFIKYSPSPSRKPISLACLASLGIKGKNRNSLACLRSAGSHFAEVPVRMFQEKEQRFCRCCEYACAHACVRACVCGWIGEVRDKSRHFSTSFQEKE
jgi:hypothetical protein